MVLIRKAYRHNQMTCPDIEFRNDHPRDVELFQCHFTTFLHFCLVFTVFGILQFVGCTRTAIFKFYLSTENPLWRELIVESHYKTGNGNGIVILLGVTLAMAIEAVDTIVLEIRNHLSIAAKAELVITKRIGFCSVRRAK